MKLFFQKGASFEFWLLFLILSEVCSSQSFEQWIIDRDVSLTYNNNRFTISNESVVSDQVAFNHRNVVTVRGSSGDLVFFSDGIQIYDKDGDIVSNDELSGSNFGPHATLVVQRPNFNNQFFVIAISRWISQGNRIYYSLVDVSNMDKIDMIGAENAEVANSENLNYVVGGYHPCNDSYWLFSVDVNLGLFYAFQVTASGILDPIISDLSVSIPLDRFPNYGGIAYNQHNQMIAVFHKGRKSIELLTLLTDGSAEFVADLPIEEPYDYISTAEFSQDGSELLAGASFVERDSDSPSWGIFRYDLIQTGTSIPRTFIGQTELTGILSNIKLGPDKNYYFINDHRSDTITGVASLGRIDVTDGYSLDTRWLPIDSDSINLIESWGTIQNSVIYKQDPLDLPDNVILDHVSHCFDQSSLLIESENFELLLWSTGDTSSAISVDAPGVYTVVADIQGCLIQDTIVVSESDDCPIPIDNCNTYLPNALSISSNRGNDSFRPLSNCELQDYRLEIYDRWGGLIYKSNNPEFSWDGSEVNTGVYSYAIGYRYALDSDMIYHSGTVTVVR